MAIRTNRCQCPTPNGTFSWAFNAGGGTCVSTNPVNAGGITDRSYKAVWTAIATSDTAGVYVGNSSLRQIAVSQSEVISISAWVRCNRQQRLAMYAYTYNASNSVINNPGISQTVEANIWTKFQMDGMTMPALADHILLAFYSVNNGAGFSRWAVGDSEEVQAVLVEPAPVAGVFFDANITDTPYKDYAWTGTANASESTVTDLVVGPQVIGKQSNIYSQLVAGGYGPGSLADMEYKRLLAANALSAPQKFTLYDLYKMAGERPRLQ